MRAAILWHTHTKITGYAIAREEVGQNNYTDTEVGTGWKSPASPKATCISKLLIKSTYQN